jgi:translation initiation factor IF-3
MLTKFVLQKSIFLKNTSKQVLKISNFQFSKKKKAIVKKNSSLYKELASMNVAQPEEQQQVSDGRITEKLLCEIIGSKYYPKNEEIKIDDNAIVTVYDESDKLQGQRILKDLKEYAYSVGKDIVLRNEKSTPPVVKVMKYRVELVKRLMKKLGRKIDKTDTKDNHKYIQLNIGMFDNDFNTKKERCREILRDTSFLRLVVPCNIDSNEQVLKATSMIRNIIDELSEISKVKINPIKRRKSKIKLTPSRDPGILDDAATHMKTEEEFKKIVEQTDPYKIENERDLEYIDSVYAELESLLVDSTGVDYEKLLEDINIEGLIKGISVTTVQQPVQSVFGTDVRQTENAFDAFTSSILDANKQQQVKIEEQIAGLEKQSILMNDKRKRIELQYKVEQMREELEYKNLSVKFKAVKQFYNNLIKESYQRSSQAKH